MRYASNSSLILLVAVLTGCGGGSQEARVIEGLGLLKEATPILTQVKDEASAKANAGKIQELADKMHKLRLSNDKAGKPTYEQGKATAQKLKAQFDPVVPAFDQEMMRLAATGLIEHIPDVSTLRVEFGGLYGGN